MKFNKFKEKIVIQVKKDTIKEAKKYHLSFVIETNRSKLNYGRVEDAVC